MKQIDCLGLACPEPVLRTKQLIEKENPVELKILVDNEAAKQNVSRFLQSQGFQASAEKKGPNFEVTGKKPAGTSCSCEAMPASDEHQKIMVLITSDCMGRGDDVLGAKLMQGFLKTLKEMGPELWRLMLINNAIKLTIEGSEAVPLLRDLAQTGVPILVCGTCLNHFQLLEKKQVGEITNMLDIVTAMQVADKVITI
ncbi:MAG: sulfurtransferase-like selenium metabolism protein YedF [Desulfobacteraceae bacterium]|nr:MAG: sulfurtransferase-like selenium metabolism protein YedF [Desulfobacteraceae bacterium]